MVVLTALHHGAAHDTQGYVWFGLAWRWCIMWLMLQHCCGTQSAQFFSEGVLAFWILYPLFVHLWERIQKAKTNTHLRTALLEISYKFFPFMIDRNICFCTTEEDMHIDWPNSNRHNLLKLSTGFSLENYFELYAKYMFTLFWTSFEICFSCLTRHRGMEHMINKVVER